MPQQGAVGTQARPQQPGQAPGANGRLKQRDIASMFSAGGRGPSPALQRPSQPRPTAITPVAGGAVPVQQPPAASPQQQQQQPPARAPLQQPTLQVPRPVQGRSPAAAHQFKAVPLGMSSS